MAERQKHGFIFEQQVIDDLSLIKSTGYTDVYDACDKEGISYQIKCIKKGSSIDMGDFFRNAKKKKDFYLIIGFWENEKKNIVEVRKLYIDYKEWNKIFEGFDAFVELKDWITNKVSNSYDYDSTWKIEMAYWKKEYGNRKIKLRFKRDHSSQRRIQCAINNRDFYDYFLKRYEIE